MGWNGGLITTLSYSMEGDGVMQSEITDRDIVVDSDFDVKNGRITAYLEIRFDTDAKFGTHTSGRDNLYAELTKRHGDQSLGGPA